MDSPILFDSMVFEGNYPKDQQNLEPNEFSNLTHSFGNLGSTIIMRRYEFRCPNDTHTWNFSEIWRIEIPDRTSLWQLQSYLIIVVASYIFFNNVDVELNGFLKPIQGNHSNVLNICIKKMGTRLSRLLIALSFLVNVNGQSDPKMVKCAEKGPGVYPFASTAEETAICPSNDCDYHFCIYNGRLNVWFAYGQICQQPSPATNPVSQNVYRISAKKCVNCVPTDPTKPCTSDKVDTPGTD